MTEDLYPPEFGPRPEEHETTDQEFRALVRERFIRRALVFVLAVLTLLCLTSTTVMVLLIRSSQTQNTETLDSSKKSLAIIKNCTTPGRDCYERAQAQTGTAITNINRVSIIAASCASGLQQRTVDEIQTCVIERLALDAKRR